MMKIIVWKIIQRILKANNAILKTNINDLNKCFTTKRIINPKMFHELKSNLKNLTQNYQNNSFYLRNTNADKVIKVIKNFIFPQNFYFGNLLIFIIQKILYKLIRVFLLFYTYQLHFLWNKSLDRYCFAFVLLVCKVLSIIMNVYNTQLFMLHNNY